MEEKRIEWKERKKVEKILKNALLEGRGGYFSDV